jgi:hypothetical protein
MLAMPETIKLQLWELVPTVIYFVVSLALFGFSLWLMNRISPFSLRKELEQDHNTAVAILMGAALIAIAISWPQ